MSEEFRVAKPDIAKRNFAYSLQIIQLYRELENDSIGRILGRQLLRSGTSVGANVHEAQGGQSKADFIAKMSIAHKEARETAYWLRLIQEAGLTPGGRISDLANEISQLIKILSAILLTAKQGAKK
jgi:four helix bundle protein